MTERAAAFPDWLPQPGCRVTLVTGPSGPHRAAAIAERRGEGDVVIDMDAILAEDPFRNALAERNARLAQLAGLSPDVHAWFSTPAPRGGQRRWWTDRLGCELLVIDPGEPAALAAAATDAARGWVRQWYAEAAETGGWRPPEMGPAARGGRVYNQRWAKARATWLGRAENRWCAPCRTAGRRSPATVVDHIVRHRRDDGSSDPKLFWDTANWQPLCATCHNSTKASFERSGRVRGADAEGRPLDPNHAWNKS